MHKAFQITFLARAKMNTEAILGETTVHQRREKLNMGAFRSVLDPYSATLERIKWHGSSDVDFSHRAAAAGQ